MDDLEPQTHDQANDQALHRQAEEPSVAQQRQKFLNERAPVVKIVGRPTRRQGDVEN
jgi:hypothetical protein